MAETFTPITTSNLSNQSSITTAIDNNNATLATLLSDVVSRSASSPNQMLATLDMNSNQIINLPAPNTSSSPLRLQDLQSFVGPGQLNITENNTTNNITNDYILNGNTYTPEAYGAVGNGSTDDTTAWQSAINAAQTAGGGTILASAKTYLISAQLNVTASNITISAPAGCTLKMSTGSAINAIQVNTNSLGTNHTLSSTAGQWSNTITLSSVTGLTVGTYLQINNLFPSSSDYSWSHTTVINAISGLVVSVADPIPFRIQTSDNYTIQPVTMLSNVFIEGINVDGTSASSAAGITVYNTVNARINKCQGLNVKGGAAVIMLGCYASSMSNILTIDSGSATVSSIQMTTCTQSYMTSCSASGPAGFGMKSNQNTYCYFSGCSTGGIGTGTGGRGFKLQGSLVCNYAGIVANNTADTGIAITLGSQHNNFTNCIAISNEDSANNGNEVGIWTNGDNNVNNFFVNCQAYNNGNYDISVNTGDTGCCFVNCATSGNINNAANAQFFNNGGVTSIGGNNNTSAFNPTTLAVNNAVSPANSPIIAFYNAHNTLGDKLLQMGVGPNSSDNSSIFVQFYDSSGATQQGQITRNGSAGVNYGTSSDVRLKENIVPTTLGLDLLNKINVRDFNFKSDPDKTVQGLIAQELAEVYPEAVSESSEYWTIDYGRLTPLLIKAIQELSSK